MSASPIVLTNVDAYLEDIRLPSTPGYVAPLILQPQYGFVPSNFAEGFPDVREVVDKRPSQSGTFDFTTLFGSRPVTLQVGLAWELTGDPAMTDRKLEDKLRRWMLPDIRAYLYIRTDPRDAYRRYLIRSSNVGSSLSFVRSSDFRSVSMSWKGIDGIGEGEARDTDRIDPGATAEAGRTYDQAYDKTYASSDVIGTKLLFNAGTAPVFPLVRIYGPVTQPRLENQTTGIKLEFLSTFSVASGDYLLIDFKEGTVYLNGDENNSRYDKVDLTVSDWWSLIQGNNLLRYYPLSFSAPSHVELDWRYGYI